MARTLGKQRTKQEVVNSIMTKIMRIDNLQALEILDAKLDKPGMDKKLIKYQNFL